VLLERIEVHNRLNGYRFSAAEFAVIAVLVTPFAAYYLVHGRFVAGLIALGIIVNCLPVVVTALASVRRADVRAEGWRGLRDPSVRERVQAEHPHLLLDTLLITSCVLLPFVAAVVVLIEMIARRR